MSIIHSSRRHDACVAPPASAIAARSAIFKASWPWALALIAATLVLRLIYLAHFCPYELAGDEAYYWQESRHLDVCYSEKGPILPWLIAASCRIFGNTELAIRLPVAICSAVAAWGAGRITLSITQGNERAAFLSVISFLLLPAFQANAQLCTQDGILIALWIGLTAAGLSLVRRMNDGRSTVRQWLALWLLLGIGFLLKQSVLVFLPSLPLYWWFVRKRIGFRREMIVQPILGVAIVSIVIAPMIVWNARHGWPMLAHTLGHLGAGGDQAGHIYRGNPLTWTLATIGGIVGAFGPACIILFILASRRTLRHANFDSPSYRDRLWLMCAAWPSVAFFVLLSLRKPVIPSWPLPSMVPLVVLLGELIAVERSKASFAYTNFKVLICYGMGGLILISFPTILAHQPIFRAQAQHALKRITGHREAAEELAQASKEIKTPDAQPPLIVTRHYMEAALDSFYLPGHPVVFTAGTYLGKRPTSFDHWADTNLKDPKLFGRSLLLDGQSDTSWQSALIFDRIEPLDGGRFFLATDYRGPRPDHPRNELSDEE